MMINRKFVISSPLVTLSPVHTGDYIVDGVDRALGA